MSVPVERDPELRLLLLRLYRLIRTIPRPASRSEARTLVTDIWERRR